MSKHKAIGERGSWCATVDGERFAFVHKHWIKVTDHLDTGYIEGEGQHPALLSAIIDKGRVVVTNDELIPTSDKKSGMMFKRLGYIAIFGVDAINAHENGLGFGLTRRVCDLI